MPAPKPKFSGPQQAMIDLVATTGPISRTGLASALGVGKPALTALSRTLVDLGVIIETREDSAAPRQGRPAMLLAMNPAYGCFAGISIAHDAPVLLLIDMAGNPVARLPIAFTTDPERLADSIATGIDNLIVMADIPRRRLLGIGVAMSGLIDANNETCIHSTLLDWHDVPLAKLIRLRTRLPTTLENDAKTAARREALFGAGHGHRDFAAITIGENIGCASFVDGRLRRGHHGGAGEIAHTTVERPGRPCKCGKRGCLDTVASRQAILNQARTNNLAVNTIADLENLAARNDPMALDIIHKAGEALGIVIAHLIQINDPELILVIDTADTVGTLMRAIIVQTVTANVLPDLAAKLRIEFTRVTGDYWSETAASVAAHTFFVAS